MKMNHYVPFEGDALNHYLYRIITSVSDYTKPQSKTQTETEQKLDGGQNQSGPASTSNQHGSTSNSNVESAPSNSASPEIVPDMKSESGEKQAHLIEFCMKNVMDYLFLDCRCPRTNMGYSLRSYGTRR